MIDTYLIPNNIGTSYFGLKENILNPPMDYNFFSSTNFFLSDKILVDKVWTNSYIAFEAENLLVPKIIETLKDNNILEEVNSKELINKYEYKELVSESLYHFIINFLSFYKKRIPLKFLEKKIDKPFIFLKELTEGNNKFPKNLNWIDRKSIEIFLNCLFTFILTGNITSRIHDPKGNLRTFYNITSSHEDAKFALKNSTVEYIIGICRQSVPSIDLFLDKDGNPTYPESPLFKHGYRWYYNEDTGVNLSKSLSGKINSDFKQFPEPNEKRTLMQLDKLLEFHKSNVCKELRIHYQQTKDYYSSVGEKEVSFANRQEFHAAWSYARAELKSKFKFSNKLDHFTDAISIPATLLSLVFPPVGAAPIATMITSRAKKYQTKNQFIKKHPWFFFAEQFGDLGVQINKQFNPKR